MKQFRSIGWHMLALTMMAFAGVVPATAQDAAAEGSESLQSGRPAVVMAGERPYRIVIDHLTRTIELQDEDGDLVERWDPAVAARGISPLLHLPPDRPVVVSIVNANSLLYDYTVDSRVVAVRGVRTCRDIGGRFASQGFLVNVGAVTGATATVNVGDLVKERFSLEAFMADLPPRGNDGASRVTVQSAWNLLEQVRAPINSYLAFVDDMSKVAASLNDSLERIAELAEFQPIDSLLGQLKSSLDRRVEGLTSPASLARAVSRANAEVKSNIGNLLMLTRSIEKGEYEGDRVSSPAKEAFALQEEVDSALTELSTSYRTIQSKLLEIERARQKSVRTFALGPSGDIRQVTINFASNEAYPEVLRLHSEAIDVYAQATVDCLCQIGIGVSWMNPPPTFGIVDDTLIANTSSKDPRISPSLQLHLSFPQLIDWIGIVGGIGLGASTTPDLYLGGTIRYFDPIILNVGLVWQRESFLPDGLAVDGPIDDPEILDDLDWKYRSQVFFGISLVR